MIAIAVGIIMILAALGVGTGGDEYGIGGSGLLLIGLGVANILYGLIRLSGKDE